MASDRIGKYSEKNPRNTKRHDRLARSEDLKGHPKPERSCYAIMLRRSRRWICSWSRPCVSGYRVGAGMGLDQAQGAVMKDIETRAMGYRDQGRSGQLVAEQAHHRSLGLLVERR